MSGLDEEFNVGLVGAGRNLKQAIANSLRKSISGRCFMSESSRRTKGIFRSPSMPIFKFLSHSKYEDRYGED